ncbi:MAG: hypothetical protein ACK4WH_09565, partial [Phycisphaerales bacterium]
AGFPIESISPVELPGGVTDTLLDVEVTSNRGDVLSHVGVARELAALTAGSSGTLSFKPPAPGSDAVFNWSPTPNPAPRPSVAGGLAERGAHRRRRPQGGPR